MNIANASPNWVFIATKTSSPKRSSTPASMAEASETGMRLIARSNQPEKPATAISTPHNKKAPIASGMATPLALVMSMAAPGVDQAVTTGTL